MSMIDAQLLSNEVLKFPIDTVSVLNLSTSRRSTPLHWSFLHWAKLLSHERTKFMNAVVRSCLE